MSSQHFFLSCVLHNFVTTSYELMEISFNSQLSTHCIFLHRLTIATVDSKTSRSGEAFALTNPRNETSHLKRWVELNHFNLKSCTIHLRRLGEFSLRSLSRLHRVRGKTRRKRFRRMLREMKIEVEFFIGCIMENRGKNLQISFPSHFSWKSEAIPISKAEENIFCTFSIRIDKEASK